MKIDYCLIGTRIKQKRKSLGLTQDALAEKLSVSVGYVSQVERGITKISLDLLGAISEILSCDIAELVSDSYTKNSGYLADEICEGFSSLNEKEKQLILGIISLMKQKSTT